jgi:hypothetical protein
MARGRRLKNAKKTLRKQHSKSQKPAKNRSSYGRSIKRRKNLIPGRTERIRGRIVKKADKSKLKKKYIVAKPSRTQPRTRRMLAKPVRKTSIVRIMGHGQFTITNAVLKRLYEIDKSIVQLVSDDRSDDVEFKKRVTELASIVEKQGKPLDPREIIQSDIILPSPDLSIDEAKKLFRGEGVVPET